jgi:hypothetical protein
MSALGHKRTFAVQKGMSAYDPKRTFGLKRIGLIECGQSTALYTPLARRGAA